MEVVAKGCGYLIGIGISVAFASFLFGWCGDNNKKHDESELIKKESKIPKSDSYQSPPKYRLEDQHSSNRGYISRYGEVYDQGYEAGYEAGRVDGTDGWTKYAGFDDSNEFSGDDADNYREGYQCGYADGYGTAHKERCDREQAKKEAENKRKPKYSIYGLH